MEEILLADAIATQDEDRLRFFLEQGADPNIETREFSLMSLAVTRNHTGIITLLHRFGADVGKVSGRWHMPLHLATKHGFLPSLHTLIALGADVNARNAEGLTALDFATTHGKLDVSLALYDYGAKAGDGTDRRNAYNVPLHYAVILENMLLLEKAIRNADDINLRCQNGRTALHSAALFCRLESLHTLLRAGADPLIEDASGKTAKLYLREHFSPQAGKRTALHQTYIALEEAEKLSARKKAEAARGREPLIIPGRP